MTEAGRLLKAAYEQTAERIENGYQVLPTRFRPIWEQIQQGYTATQTVLKDYDDYDMYNVCYSAGIEYDKTVKRIGIDNAFSTVACAIGIQHESPDWYRIMAHHYTKQAERIELNWKVRNEY